MIGLLQYRTFGAEIVHSNSHGIMASGAFERLHSLCVPNGRAAVGYVATVGSTSELDSGWRAWN